MSGNRVKIEFGRVLDIFTFKSHFPVSRTQIKRFFIIQFEHGISGFDHTGTAHIEDPHFTAGKEIRRFQRIDSLQLQYLPYGSGSSYNHAVIHGINHVHLIVRKYFFH